MLKKILLSALVATAMGNSLNAQLQTRNDVLKQAGSGLLSYQTASRQRALQLAPEKGWPISYTNGNGDQVVLVGVDILGHPQYLSTESNVLAATTTGTTQLWAGGSSGLNLSGSSNSVNGRVAIWDGGRVRADHVELVSRPQQQDAPGALSDHATHVTGTIMALGIDPQVKGMAYGLQSIKTWDFNNDIAEMFPAAAGTGGIIISNHSYGFNSGWSYNSDQSRWEWLGNFGDTADYKFGYYDATSQLWDSLAYNAPYYLMVKSAGNNRNENGPAIGGTYWGYNASGNLVNMGGRPSNISFNNGYDILSTTSCAKNILTVGAVKGIAAGYAQPTDVVMTDFSSWGPTDDGRIKPDIVADGDNLKSCISTSTTSYAVYSGTSMSSPNTTGSLLLLQEYWAQLHSGSFMRSATLKGLAIHTANEAGPANGPDYKYGWGLLNVAKAADVIRYNNITSHLILEQNLVNSQTFSTNVVASGAITVTLVWTDPKAGVLSSNLLNNPAKRLVNDLDVRISDGTTTFMPWILDPANPSANATTGDNNTDNVEKINAYNAIPGHTYTITVSHKGTLARGQQAYSLIISGVAVTPIDLSLDDITVPGLTTCPGPGQLATIKVKNLGSQDRTNVPVGFEARTGTTFVAGFSATIPGTIPAGETRTYTFQTPFTLNGGTTYDFVATVNDPSDPNRPNDSLKKTVTMATVSAAPTGFGQICGSQAILSVNSPVSPDYYYYDSPTATSSLGRGLQITTSTIPSNNTYYISEGGSGSVGLTSKANFPNGGGYLNTPQYIKYTASASAVLESARLYTKYWGQAQVIVADLLTDNGSGTFTYTTLSTTTIDVYPTSSTFASGQQLVYDATDTGARFYLGITLPAGSHIIVIKPLGNTNLFANTNLTGTNYPYSLGGVLDLTGNSGGTAYQNNYYYLYDMKIRTPTCPSARGTIVASVAPTPVITQNGATLTSSVTSGIQWYRNNVLISGATNANFNPTQSGTYTVTYTDVQTGCQRTSANYNYVATAVSNVVDPNFALQVSPNPAKGQFVVRYHTERREDVTIQLVNAQGQEILRRENKAVLGDAAEPINVSNYAAGVYLVKVIHAGKVEYRKMLME